MLMEKAITELTNLKRHMLGDDAKETTIEALDVGIESIIRQKNIEREFMKKLKPCPFCNGEPIYVYPEMKCISDMRFASKKGTIKCNKCGVVLPHIYSSISKAEVAWNRRAEVT